MDGAARLNRLLFLDPGQSSFNKATAGFGEVNDRRLLSSATLSLERSDESG